MKEIENLTKLCLKQQEKIEELEKVIEDLKSKQTTITYIPYDPNSYQKWPYTGITWTDYSDTLYSTSITCDTNAISSMICHSN